MDPGEEKHVRRICQGKLLYNIVKFGRKANLFCSFVIFSYICSGQTTQTKWN